MNDDTILTMTRGQLKDMLAEVIDSRLPVQAKYAPSKRLTQPEVEKILRC